MKTSVLNGNIVHLDFDDQKELTKSMIRFQETYESPKFRGEIIDLNEYKKWYQESTGIIRALFEGNYQ